MSRSLTVSAPATLPTPEQVCPPRRQVTSPPSASQVGMAAEVREISAALVGLGFLAIHLDQVTSSVSGLLRELAHVRQARSRCLRCCPGLTVITLSRPSHRARGGHGQNLQIRSLVSEPDDTDADLMGPDAALRAVEPPGDDRPRLAAWIPLRRVQGSGGRVCDLANLCDLPARTRSLILRAAKVIPRIFRIAETARTV